MVNLQELLTNTFSFTSNLPISECANRLQSLTESKGMRGRTKKVTVTIEKHDNNKYTFQISLTSGVLRITAVGCLTEENGYSLIQGSTQISDIPKYLFLVMPVLIGVLCILISSPTTEANETQFGLYFMLGGAMIYFITVFSYKSQLLKAIKRILTEKDTPPV